MDFSPVPSQTIISQYPPIFHIAAAGDIANNCLRLLTVETPTSLNPNSPPRSEQILELVLNCMNTCVLGSICCLLQNAQHLTSTPPLQLSLTTTQNLRPPSLLTKITKIDIPPDATQPRFPSQTPHDAAIPPAPNSNSIPHPNQRPTPPHSPPATPPQSFESPPQSDDSQSSSPHVPPADYARQGRKTDSAGDEYTPLG